MSNNGGSNAIYHYELFNHPDTENLCDFNVSSALTPGMAIRCNPMYYNGVDENNENGLNCGKFPICSWSTDVYTNWLTQNGVNIGLGMASGVLQIVGGVAMTAGSGGLGGFIGAGTVAGGVGTIASSIGEIYQHALNPTQAQGNINSGDVSLPKGNLTFTAYQMSIKSEYAKIIDEYFTAYGYKVNRFKVPNKAHRSRFWYTKTLDINIDGGIPAKDMEKIKSCYNNGITFWRNANEINDYSLSNGIV